MTPSQSGEIVQVSLYAAVELGTFAFGLVQHAEDEGQSYGYYGYYGGSGSDYSDYDDQGAQEVNLLDQTDGQETPAPTYQLLLPASSLPEPLFVLNLVVQSNVLVGFVDDGNYLPPTEQPLLALRLFVMEMLTGATVCLADTA